MIFQVIELFRYLNIFILQTLYSAFLFYLAYRILKRNLNRITINLSLFYFSSGLGLFLSIIFILISNTALGIIIYYLAAYFITFGPIFLVVFIQNLLKVNSSFPTKGNLIIISLYGIILFLLISIASITGAITINTTTNWIPIYSWSFLIALYIFFSIFVSLPTIIFSIKLYTTFKDKELKKKLMFFFLGIFGIFIAFYGLILYNTWQEPIYRFAWPILSLLTIPSGYLIYYGIVRNL